MPNRKMTKKGSTASPSVNDTSSEPSLMAEEMRKLSLSNQERKSSFKVPIPLLKHDQDFGLWKMRMISYLKFVPMEAKSEVIYQALDDASLRQFVAVGGSSEQTPEAMIDALDKIFGAKFKEQKAEVELHERRQKPGESVSEYTREMTQLLALAYPEGPTARDETRVARMLIRGLENETQKAMLHYICEGKTFADTTRIVKDFAENVKTDFISAVAQKPGPVSFRKNWKRGTPRRQWETRSSGYDRTCRTCRGNWDTCPHGKKRRTISGVDAGMEDTSVE